MPQIQTTFVLFLRLPRTLSLRKLWEAMCSYDRDKASGYIFVLVRLSLALSLTSQTSKPTFRNFFRLSLAASLFELSTLCCPSPPLALSIPSIRTLRQPLAHPTAKFFFFLRFSLCAASVSFVRGVTLLSSCSLLKITSQE